MKPTKAYILKIDSSISNEYAKTASDSCDRIELPWEYFEGYSNMSMYEAYSKTGIDIKGLERYKYHTTPDNPMCCSAGHAAIWKKIADNNECAIILEHDALMFHKIEIDVPDNVIVVLGYKTTTPEKYNYVDAGPPETYHMIEGHEGAHAYVLTPTTAKSLVKEIETVGILGCIDNAYFLKFQRKSRVPVAIMDPTPAIAWLRTSTLWPSSAYSNYAMLPSFLAHFNL
jgi:GR25 family glycosyltransferase involved in LPS biosynthesis